MDIQYKNIYKFINKIYIKGSGGSACLLNRKFNDQEQFVQVYIQGRIILQIKLSGLFAIALTKLEKENYQIVELVKWGNFNNKYIFQPEIIQLPKNVKVMGISCGWNHALFNTNEGKLFGIGQNKYGQLGGQFPKQFINQPKLIIPNKNQQEFVEIFAAGFRQSYWMNKTNKIFGCGQSKNYELGPSNKKQIIDIIQIQIDKNEDKQSNDKKINNKFVKIVCGKKYMIALNNNYQVFAIGTNQYQCLVDNQTIKYYKKLTKIRQNIHQIGSGWTHTIMMDKNHKIISRGRNNLGQLGQNSVEGNLNDEVKIPQQCQQIAVGTEFNFAISNSGKLYGWGWNEHMNIIPHHNSQTIIYKPTIVPIPHNFTLTQCITYPAITILIGYQP